MVQPIEYLTYSVVLLPVLLNATAAAQLFIRNQESGHRGTITICDGGTGVSRIGS